MKQSLRPAYFIFFLSTTFKTRKEQPNLLTGHDGLCPESRVLSGEKRSDSHPEEDH